MADERITCPACQSAISADGRTLFERSARLSDAEESADLLEKAMARIDALEAELAKLKGEPTPEPKPAKKSKGGKTHVGPAREEKREWGW